MQSARQSVRQFVTRLLPSFFISWLLTFSLASLFHSQYVVNQLVNLGIEVGINVRTSLVFDDWLGLLPTYGSIIAIALLIAFSLAGWLVKRLNNHRNALFVTAGILAFVVVLTAINSIMHINIIAGARGWGFYLQLLAGAIGGYVFAMLSQRKLSQPKPNQNERAQ
ncbi:hypothetical protein DXX93_14970 [Thalassotalea euphylliae]|uniref:Uncharacterized protein n=1 Tax=Thalassotalea euphylliae TaxID=1655234 RepID=A0A3E0TSU5_9GAMM|nr:hypothetical protein [Thalassotalea euphylliae]REL27731.1 hypothetical protein DXX93_14970 [Thalassotalea euphylliae]